MIVLYQLDRLQSHTRCDLKHWNTAFLVKKTDLRERILQSRVLEDE